MDIQSTPEQSPTKRKSPQTPAQKLKQVLDAIGSVGWSLSEFFFYLFRLEDVKPKDKPQEGTQPVKRDLQHSRMLTALLNGTSKPSFGTIINLIHRNTAHIDYKSGDQTALDNVYKPGISPTEINHAKPALTVWAVQLVAKLVCAEGLKMINQDSGLHLRARHKAADTLKRNHAPQVSWDAVSSFSMIKMQQTAETIAPVLWHIISSYVNPAHENDTQVLLVRQNRPQNIVCTNAVMSLTFGRSDRANLYPMCRGIWYFAVKAHQSIFRVESRLGQSVAYSSVYAALHAMAEQGLEELKGALASGCAVFTVSDNIQAWIKQRDHRIGRESRMVTGLGGTAVETQDTEEGAFDLKDLVQRQSLQERKALTAEMIDADIDWGHLEHIAVIEILQPLFDFVPVLSAYKLVLTEWATERICKNPIPKHRRSKITPLATNSANEMLIQEMKRGVLDFASTQMGITEDTLKDRCWVYSGDGKTFDQLLKLKKYMAAESSDFESFRWLVPLLELWHTKWTDLSRVVRAHWGKDYPDDPSTLAHAAKLAQCPTPSDLRKVDFYDGQHLVNLTLDAHLLNIWETHFETSNLVMFFEEKKNNDTIPDFETLLEVAHKLSRRHATTQAYQRARHPRDDIPNDVPLGSPWVAKEKETGSNRSVDVDMEGDLDSEDEDGLSELSEPSNPPTADITLANTTLFIRNAIWWREMCKAVATGDPGRVWEILKLWVFTFSGSGNPYYSQYLLELYCNFKWEFPPKLRHAILMNWVVNLHGKPGMFIEMDLMQEHFNFWLEDLAQHKGKEFDEPFYRSVLSMNVHHFLRLKDEMEQDVSLRARTKKHSAPHLNNELKALMDSFRSEEVNKRRPGRNEGFEAVDDFAKGYEILKKDKIKNFVTKSTVYLDILGLHGGSPTNVSIPDDMVVDEITDDAEGSWGPDGRDELPTRGSGVPPPPRMYITDSGLYVEELRQLDD